MKTDFVLFNEIPGKCGNVGEIILNRSDALNALDRSMCVAIKQQLMQWSSSPAIKAVIIHATKGRAFCAGGDIRKIYHALLAKKKEEALQFFQDEYDLNRTVFHFPKPYIALLDGMTIGGGAGISIHGSHRITTENFTFAMPETGIGLFPDVGASYFLSRCPGFLGLYLGLSGTFINARDTHDVKLTDAHLESSQLSVFIEQLAHTDLGSSPNDTIHALLKPLKKPFDAPATLEANRAWIDTCFSHTSIESIFLALQQHPNHTATVLYNTLLQKSPTSLKVTLRNYLTAKSLDFDACMRLEYRIVSHFLNTPDFREGVRAAIIDKDKTPRWSPNSIENVTDKSINHFFMTDH